MPSLTKYYILPALISAIQATTEYIMMNHRSLRDLSQKFWNKRFCYSDSGCYVHR